MLKRLLSTVLPARYRRRMKLSIGLVDHQSRLENLRRCGFRPKAAVDGGAYRGDWARVATGVFPDIRLLLVEPQPRYADHLRRGDELSRVVCECALGEGEGNADFTLEETNSRVVAHAGERTIRVRVRPLDTLLAESDFPAPDLIKLDVQGAELKALEGGRTALRNAEVVCMEVSVLRVGEVPLLHEVIAFMEAAGFRLYDVYGQNYRPRDQALWQLDTIFVSRRSELIASREWGVTG